MVGIFIALLICPQPSVRSQTCDTTTLRAIEREAVRAPMGYTWLEWSTRSIGHRLTGSTNGRRAEESADSLFRVAGMRHIAFSPFQATAWQRYSAGISFAGPDGVPVPCSTVALAMTPDSADIRALVVDVGNGLATDFDSLDRAVHGAIALVNLHLSNAPPGAVNLHRSEKVALAIQHGAIGVVFANAVDGGVLLTGTASVTNQPIAIPAVCIGKEDAVRLRERLVIEKPVHAHITMRNSSIPITARNVLATLHGTDKAEDVIVVGGHLDSWDLATGATDNGIGSYSIIDLARCYVALGLRPRRTIVFALFMGEEQGLLGSTALVNEWARSGQLDHVKCMINLDMSGDPSGFNAFGPEHLRTLVSKAQQDMRALDTTYAARASDAPWLHSDHQPFMLHGVATLNPICDLGERVYRCYHSDCDDLRLVDPAVMASNVQRVGEMLWLLANADDLPDHFKDEELRSRLVAGGLEEKLRLHGEWRW